MIIERTFIIMFFIYLVSYLLQDGCIPKVLGREDMGSGPGSFSRAGMKHRRGKSKGGRGIRVLANAMFQKRKELPHQKKAQ